MLSRTRLSLRRHQGAVRPGFSAQKLLLAPLLLPTMLQNAVSCRPDSGHPEDPAAGEPSKRVPLLFLFLFPISP